MIWSQQKFDVMPYECRLAEFEKSYDYMGNATCAADGMCQTKCPVAINTGSLIKSLRADELSKATKTTRFAQVPSHSVSLNPGLFLGLQDLLVPVIFVCFQYTPPSSQLIAIPSGVRNIFPWLYSIPACSCIPQLHRPMGRECQHVSKRQ